MKNLRYKTALIILTTLFLLIGGCRPAKEIHTYDRIIVRDTIMHYQLERDTVYSFASETIYIDKGQFITKPLRLENDFSIATAWIENNKLAGQITNKLDSIPIEVKYIDREVVRVERIPEKQPIGWYIWAIIAGLVLALLIAIIR
jgi:hypothetical protein